MSTPMPPMRLCGDPVLDLPDKIVTEKIGILGQTGSGKTYFARKMAELMIARGHHVVILDPVGVWYGMRRAASRRRGEGMPVLIVGGPHGDLPLTVEGGAVMARTALDTRRSMILDLSDLRKGAQMKFIQHFGEELYYRSRKARNPLHLIIDEADYFAPQGSTGGISGQAAFTLGAIEDIVRRGRARGIGVTMITQRPARINKNVLTQISTLVAMRLSSPQDRKAIKEWVQVSANADRGQEVLDDLPTLGVGEAIIWSPASLKIYQWMTCDPIDTFDSSATPDAGSSTEPPGPLAEIDLDALKSELGKAIKEQEGDDPTTLRAEIDRLKGELNAASSAATEQAGVSQEKHDKALSEYGKSRFAEGVRAGLRESVGVLSGMIENPDLSSMLDNRAPKIQEPQVPEVTARNKRRPKANPSPATGQPQDAQNVLARGPDTARDEDAPKRVDVDLGAVNEAQRRILDSLAWWQAVGVDAPLRAQVAFMAGYTVNGYFNRNVGNLAAGDVLEYPDTGRVRSMIDLDPPETPTTREQYEKMIKERLTLPEQKIIDAMLELSARRVDESVERPLLAAKAGYTVNGFFNRTVGRMKTIGLLQYPSRGRVAVTHVLCPPALSTAR